MNRYLNALHYMGADAIVRADLRIALDERRDAAIMRRAANGKRWHFGQHRLDLLAFCGYLPNSSDRSE